jgi:hypothetical protein
VKKGGGHFEQAFVYLLGHQLFPALWRW